MEHSSLELSTMRTFVQGRCLHAVKAGDVILRPGDRGDCLYGVVNGSVKLSWADNSLFELIETAADAQGPLPAAAAAGLPPAQPSNA